MTSSNASSAKSSGSSRAKLELQYQALRELMTRRRHAPLLFYRPHRKQEIFHAMGREKRRRLILGGNRSGKTHSGAAEALAHALGYYYWLVPDFRLTSEGDPPPRETIPPEYWVRRVDGIPVRVPNVGMIVTGLAHGRGIGEIIHPKIHGQLPSRWRTAAKAPLGPGSVPFHLLLPNGSKILYASGEQKDRSFEGFPLDWAWIDEPVRQKIYNGLWARLIDFLGPIWITMTPIGSDCAWLYSTWYLDPDDDIGIINYQQDDNFFLSAQAREAFVDKASMSEAEYRARRFGTFEFLGARVFELFDPTVHIIDPRPIGDDYIRILSVDPHSKRPAFMLWLAYNSHTQQYIAYREWPSADFFKMTGGARTPAEYAAIIRNSEGREQVSARVCDPRYGKSEFTVNGQTHTAWAELMGDYGMEFDARVPNVGRVEYGHQVINDLLRYDHNQPISPANEPRLLIFNTCQNLCNAFMNYSFENIMREKVSEDFKDPIDALRYGVLYPPPAHTATWERMQPWTLREFEDMNYAEDDIMRID